MAARNTAQGFWVWSARLFTGGDRPPPLTPYTLRNHPWDSLDSQRLTAHGVMAGAADGWCVDGRFAVLFHTTTEANAAAILSDGFNPSPPIEVGGHPSLGVSGRQMPAGIWASIRPTIPNDSDTALPDVCGHPWAVLQMVVPSCVLADRCIFEPTWPVAQFCLKPADVLGVCILPPEQMPLLIHPATVRKLASFRADYHRPSPYLDAIDAAAAIDGAQEVG